ncbi:hypothetical protein Droror1_Dr00009869 [Drosera rotundifolia]
MLFEYWNSIEATSVLLAFLMELSGLLLQRSPAKCVSRKKKNAAFLEGVGPFETSRKKRKREGQSPNVEQASWKRNNAAVFKELVPVEASRMRKEVDAECEQ